MPRSPFSPPPPSTCARGSSEALNRVEKILEGVDHRLKLAEWRRSAGYPASGLLTVQAERARLLAAPGLMEWCDEAGPRASSPIESRRFELLGRMALEAKLEHNPSVAGQRDSLQRKMYRFRPKINGRPVTHAELMDTRTRSHDQSERRKAFFAMDELYRRLEEPVRELIETRNDVARDLGFKGFADAYLAMGGLSTAFLEDLIDDLPMARFQKIGTLRGERFKSLTQSDEWLPWDDEHLNWLEAGKFVRSFPSKGIVESTLSTLREWGFGKEALGFKISRRDSPYVGCEWAVDAPRDVRVIVNPMNGLIYYDILLHEMGHAVHSRSVRGATHLMRSHEFAPSFNGLLEGIGGMFEEITYSENWLRSRPGIGKREIPLLQAQYAEGMALRLASLAAEVHCELKLYQNPGWDIGPELERSRSRVMDYDDHRERSWVDPFYLDVPLYNQCYLLSCLFGPQMCEAAFRDIGGELWPNSRMGPWLTDTWFKHGAAFDWLQRVHEVTGRPLGPRALMSWLAEAPDVRVNG